jgi:hypothetical protein
LFPSSSFYPAVGVSLPVLPFLSSNFQSTKWLANGISCTANNKKRFRQRKKKQNRSSFFHFFSIFHFLTGFNALLLLLLPLSYSHTYYNHLVHLSLGLSQSGWESLDRQTRADTTAHTAS